MIFSFLLKNWRIGLLVAGLAATFGTMGYLKLTNDRLSAEVEAAEADAVLARTAAKTERAAASALAERLEQARADLRAERAALRAAQRARDEALAASQERGDQLSETIIIEREADVTLDQCLALELPDSVVRQLPFGPR